MKRIPEIDDDLYTIQEVASKLSVCVNTVLNYIKKGYIPSVRWFDERKPKMRGSARYVLKSELDEFIVKRLATKK